MKLKSIFASIVLCAIMISCVSADEPKKEGWAKVPGGTVWLNPGDSYEHSTGYVRDSRGQHRIPTQPSHVAPQVSHQVSQPAVHPQHYSPNGYPVYGPLPVHPSQHYQPYYQPAYPTYPTHPQLDPRFRPSPQYRHPSYRPYCPTCPNRGAYHDALGFLDSRGNFDPNLEKKTGMQQCQACGQNVLGKDMDLSTGRCKSCVSRSDKMQAVDSE